jgi:hypothetical protein
MSDTKLTLRLSKGQAVALYDAAINRQTAPAPYVLFALLNQLRTDGYEPPAGFALVHDGAFVRDEEGKPISCGLDYKPDGFSSKYPADSQWLPIVNADAEPFNHATQYRLTPFLRLCSDYVQRVYPIVSKADPRAL